MPRLPEYLAREQLPATGGLPRGTIPIPVVPQPGADGQAGTLLARSLGAAGEAVSQAGTFVLRAEEFQAARQRAQALLDAKTHLQEYRLHAQPLYDRLRQGDYQTFPETLVDEGTQLIADMGLRLSPQARAVFREEATQFLGLQQQKAFDERIRRRDQATTFVLVRESQHLQERMASATTPLDRLSARDDFERTMSELVQAGLADGARAADVVRKTLDAVAVQDVQIMIQAHPDAMRRQLRAQTQGDPTREDLPLAPRAHLAALTQEAAAVYRERLTEIEHHELMTDRRRATLQGQVAMDLRSRLTEIVPTPENVPQYDALLTEINTRARAGALAKADHDGLLTEQRTLRATAVNPPQVDDPATERRLVLLLAAADNPQDFAEVRTQIVQASMRLKVDTFKGLLLEAKDRERADHWSNLPGVKAGMQTILGGDVGSAAFLPMTRSADEHGEQIRLREAVDAYKAVVQALAEGTAGTPGSAARANAEAPGLALDLRRRMVDQPKQDAKIKSLPPGLQSPTLLDGEAMDYIRSLGLPNREKGRLWQRYKEAHTPLRPTETPTGAPVTPGPRVKTR